MSNFNANMNSWLVYHSQSQTGLNSNNLQQTTSMASMHNGARDSPNSASVLVPTTWNN